MTAYGAVNSLRNTIHYILNSSHYSLVEPSPHILQLADLELDPLQEILEKLDSTRTSKSRKKVNGLDERIKELIWEFEDLLESLLYQQILSQSCADQVDDEMKERVWEFGGLLESIPSQPHPQFIFQSPLPHPTATTSRRRKLVVHKHKGDEDEDEVGGKRMRFSIDLHFLQSEASQSRNLEVERIMESLIYQQILSQVEDEKIMEEGAWGFQGLLESLPQPQFIFQSPLPHHTTTTRRLVVHKHKGRKFNTPRIIKPHIPLQSHTTTRRRRRLVVQKHNGRKFCTPRSLEDDVRVERIRFSIEPEPEPEPKNIFQSPLPHHINKYEASRVGDERMRFSIDLQFLQHHVPSFVKRLKDMEEEYIYEVDNMPEDEDDGDQSISSRSGIKSKFIGLSDQLDKLANRMEPSFIHFNITALVGAAGIGKTALAEAVFNRLTSNDYEHRVWVTVGRRSQSDGVFREILCQMFGITHVDDDFGAYLKERLEGKNTLIVLDDVWERQILDSLESSLRSIRSIGSGYTKILVTTRDRNTIPPGRAFTMLVRFLNEEESKELLCEKVFGEKDCPFQLDKAATKIAKKCEGLPLTIVTVADILSKSQNTDPKYWDDVAEIRNSVFMDAYNEISKVLFPSYDYLPQYLKMPFLYMGVFSQDYDIPLSKLMNMLATECWFHNTKKEQSLVNSVSQCLDELCRHRNLALSKKRIWEIGEVIVKIKTCRLHSSWRYVCRGVARKNKFYHVLKKGVEGLEDGVKGQRCLCLENNLLFGIKEFCSSMRLNCASSARSLLFYGPYHQYPVPIGDDFKLLGKLDALNLRLYTFPTEILTLVLLKYLALTCNGELPTTISKLFNLRVLIVHPHNNIRICRAPSYVPIQIWDMKELEHIEILGKSLVAPRHSASLEKLSAFVGVNASISTILELSRKVPCIRKLGVQIELAPYYDHNNLISCFGRISTLGSLEILKCSIINPVFRYNVAFSSSLMIFPSGLKKLHLSGTGFPWEYMDVIGSLPCLKVLKLRAYAFRGSKWEAQEGSFMKVEFLLIEDSDLVQWKPRSGSFLELRHLSMKHCYKIEEIHWFGHGYGTIELENCNPVVAEQIQPNSYSIINVTASSSFDGKPITTKFQRGRREPRR